MTAPKPLLPLTSIERRIAEIAYAANAHEAAIDDARKALEFDAKGPKP